MEAREILSDLDAPSALPLAASDGVPCVKPFCLLWRNFMSKETAAAATSSEAEAAELLCGERPNESDELDPQGERSSDHAGSALGFTRSGRGPIEKSAPACCSTQGKLI